MKLRERAPGFPLLAKELIEQAARKRTYVLRSVYAAMLGLFALLLFYTRVYRNAVGLFDVLGRGAQLFDSLLTLQVLGIYLFMPALMSGVITGEKERSTLGLLLLTRLKPWSIVMEKFLSRQMAMGTYLLMAVPALMFCYALGGLYLPYIGAGLWMLVVTSLQVGAVSLFCSAWCRTTAQAFILSYAVLAGLYVLPLATAYLIPFVFWLAAQMAVSALAVIMPGIAAAVDSFVSLFGYTPFYGDPSPTLLLDFEVVNGKLATLSNFRQPPGPVGFASPGLRVSIPMAIGMLIPSWGLGSLNGLYFLQSFILSLPSLATVGLMLAAARRSLVRRAFIEPKNRLLKFFRLLDRMFQRLNENRLTRGIILMRENTTLPAYEPVVWRETQKKALGTIRYLVRVLVALEVPAAFLCLLTVVTGFSYREPISTPVKALAFFFWTIAFLFVGSRASGLVAGERQHETLDVLLSTPLWCRDIIAQKMRGIRRLMWVVALPIMTCIATQTLYRWEMHSLASRRTDPPSLYFLVTTISLVIQLPIVAWIGLFFSLRLRSQGRAIFATLAVIAGWTTLGVLAEELLISSAMPGYESRYPSVGYLLQAICPPMVIIIAESGRLMFCGGPWWLMCLMLHAGLLMLIRRCVLKQAAQWLGRAEIMAD